MIGEVGGELRHAADVARGADPPALAGEREQAFVAAVGTAGAGESVGEDAAAQIGPEVLLDPRRNAMAQGIGLGGLSEEGLEVVPDNWVKGCGSGLVGPVGRPRRSPVRSTGGPNRGSEETLRRGRHGGAWVDSRSAAMG